MNQEYARQHGFGMIAAIVILVILAALAAAITSFSSVQHGTAAQDILSGRAWQAARAGNEWGLYHVVKGLNWPTAATKCDTATTAPIHETLVDLLSETGFRVRVSCESMQYNEGECAFSDTDPACVIHPSDPARKVKITRIFRITSMACNAANCPSADASSPYYIERTRVVMATN